MNWKDITIDKFYQIRDILSVQDEYTTLNLISCLYDVDATEIPITQLGKYDIRFLNNEITPGKVRKRITLNGRKYAVDCDLTHVTAVQFVDFNNHISKKEYMFEDALSVFIVPEGHKYNDGYDMNEVKNDIKQLSIVDANEMCKFFFLQFSVFVETFRHSLTTSMKKMNWTEEESKQVNELLEEMDSLSSVLYHIF